MKKYVLAFTALAAFAFADNSMEDALKKGDSMSVSEKSHNTPEKLTATPNEIKDVASSVETAKPAPVHSVKVVKSSAKPVKMSKKSAKIAKKHGKSTKIAKKSAKKSHKKVVKKASKKHAKKA